MHRVRFGIAFLAHDVRFGAALSSNRLRLPIGFDGAALARGFGENPDPLPFRFGWFLDGGYQLQLLALDLRLLHLRLLFALHPLDSYLLGNNLLLHDVGLQLVGLVRTGLLRAHGGLVFRLLQVEVALRLRLAGEGSRLGDLPLLIGLRASHRCRPLGFGPPNRRVAFCLRRGNVRLALDAGDVRLAHVGDVVVHVANFADRERDDLQPHLVEVLGAGAPNFVGDHFGLLHDLLDRQLAHDAAEMPLHDQADEALAFFLLFVQKLFGRGLNALRIRFDLDLRDRLDRHGDALRGVKVLRRGDVERHQLQRQIARALDHRPDHAATALHDVGTAEAVDDERLVWPDFAKHAPQNREQGEQSNQDENRNDDYRRESRHFRSLRSGRLRRDLRFALHELFDKIDEAVEEYVDDGALGPHSNHFGAAGHRATVFAARAGHPTRPCLAVHHFPGSALADADAQSTDGPVHLEVLTREERCLARQEDACQEEEN